MTPKRTKDAAITLDSRKIRKANEDFNEDGVVFGQLLDGLNQV